MVDTLLAVSICSYHQHKQVFFVCHIMWLCISNYMALFF